MKALKTIESRHKGHRSGPITRLISPGDLGERLKPFVFLDFLNAHLDQPFGFDFHPHSGIATLTYQLDTDVKYVDTEGHEGILKAQGLEWMQAGGGAWHKGTLLAKGQITGFQLWLALPPAQENGPSFSTYIAPDAVPSEDGVHVLLGRGRKFGSPLKTPTSVNYFDIELSRAKSWQFEVPETHEVSWAFVYQGDATVNGLSSSQELLVLSEAGHSIEIKAAQSAARIIFGSAEKHKHDLVNGYSSVHTSAEALKQGEERIRELGARLKM